MKVLCVGGAGYLGGTTVDALEKAGHHVRVFDSLLHHDLYMREVEFVRGSINSEALDGNVAWADRIVWLAALVGDAACNRQPEEAERVNHGAVAWLARNYLKRIVFTSTCSVYGHGEGVLDETCSVAPLSVYARTKLAAEQELAAKNAVVLRLGTLYGVGDRHGRFRLDLVVNGMTVKAVLERRVEVHDGNQWRPLTHVRDAARAIVQSIEAETAGTFNVVGENMTIKGLASIIRREVGDDVRVEFSPGGSDARNYRVSGTHAWEVLGFAPGLGVADGIREVRDLVVSGRLGHPESRRFTNS